MIKFVKDYNIVTEPACGASIFAADRPDYLEKYFGNLLKYDIFILIACNGSSSYIEDVIQYQDIIEKNR
ncbi:hypothetical protein DASC09_052110 [Saccharomycopsis crataegensis]|uniref:Tryptophan synthase beta chain-like PALP domain-containing protein n=1 Tax=Saccharomycopsis crataegensis TaxID=43959 RepID=A0AAV5QT58_9ASCO|nr:hypothetical protein DASC09_052110 [Saccharomycopsis crataegensis]